MKPRHPRFQPNVWTQETDPWVGFITAKYTDYDHMVTLTELALMWLTDLVLHGSQTKQKFTTPRRQTSEHVSVKICPLEISARTDTTNWFLIMCNWCWFNWSLSWWMNMAAPSTCPLMGSVICTVSILVIYQFWICSILLPYILNQF